MSEWISVKSVPKDESEFLLGKYYIDDCNGYCGESRWIWIIQGSFDEYGNFWDTFNDEEIVANHMVLARQATHWMSLPEPPE